MTVYVEYVIIDNFIFDFLILKLALKGSEVRTSLLRTVLASLWATLFAVLFPLLKLHQLVLFLLKIVLCVSVVALGGRFKSFKGFLKGVNKFLLITFLFGGSIYGLASLVGLDYSFLYGTTNGAIPLGVMIAVAVLIYFALSRAIQSYYERRIIYPFIRKIELVNKGHKIDVTGLIDSGNRLIYKNQSGVCVAGRRLARRMLLEGFLEQAPHGELTFSTVAGQNVLKIYEIDSILIYNGKKEHIINRPRIGVGVKGFELSDEYDLILSAEYALIE